jgi:hypothetical protein
MDEALGSIHRKPALFMFLSGKNASFVGMRQCHPAGLWQAACSV